MNQTVFSQELVLTCEAWKVLGEIVPYEFGVEFLRGSLQFSYGFAIFI